MYRPTQVPLLCLIGCIILSIGLGLVFVDGSNIKEKISRVARNACGTACEGDNFDTSAFHCDGNLNKCCRVCEKGKYKSSNCWYDNVREEDRYNCSYCEEGFYQPDYNIETECKKCPPPSITCQPGEKIHCDRETAEYSCQEDITTQEITTVPELSTSSSGEADNVTRAAPNKSATQENGLTVGISIAVIITALLICVSVYCYYNRRHQIEDCCITRHSQRKTEGDYHEMDEDGGAAATTNNVSHGPRENDSEETEGMLDRTKNSETQSTGGRDAISQQGDEDNQEVEPTAQPGVEGVDDSYDYTLKDDVTFNEFKLEVAERLPLKTMHTFYARIGLDRNEYEHAEADEPGNLMDKKYAVLDKWAEKRGDLGDDWKVQKLLSAMWRHNLKDTRRVIIEKCCCNCLKADLLLSSEV